MCLHIFTTQNSPKTLIYFCGGGGVFAPEVVVITWSRGEIRLLLNSTQSRNDNSTGVCDFPTCGVLSTHVYV